MNNLMAYRNLPKMRNMLQCLRRTTTRPPIISLFWRERLGIWSMRDQAAKWFRHGIQLPWILREPYGWARKKEALLKRYRWVSICVSSVMKPSTCLRYPGLILQTQNIESAVWLNEIYKPRQKALFCWSPFVDGQLWKFPLCNNQVRTWTEEREGLFEKD